MSKIYDWDEYKYLGEITEVPYIYRIIGMMNEFQVTTISKENTYPGSILDYGSLIWAALQSSRSARECYIYIYNCGFG